MAIWPCKISLWKFNKVELIHSITSDMVIMSNTDVIADGLGHSCPSLLRLVKFLDWSFPFNFSLFNSFLLSENLICSWHREGWKAHFLYLFPLYPFGPELLRLERPGIELRKERKREKKERKRLLLFISVFLALPWVWSFTHWLECMKSQSITQEDIRNSLSLPPYFITNTY